MTTKPPDLSVIVALKCSRTEDPLDGIRAWSQGQDNARDRLEVVVASNGDHPEWEARLPEVLTARDQHVQPESRVSTAGLLDAGGRAARGKWLYFCELHTIPDADCAAELLAELDANDWAGAVANSGSLGEGRLARAEARYYQEVVGSFAGSHPAVVAGRGVAIRADLVSKIGGVPDGFSIFYERVIQAHLRDLGARIGFAERAHFVHAEQTSISGHRVDVGLFTAGEHAFRSSHDPDFCDRHLGRPEDWAERLGYRRDVARARAAVVALAAWQAIRGGRGRAALALLGEGLREFGRTLFGAWGEIAFARTSVAWRELRFLLARTDATAYPHYLAIKRDATTVVRRWCAAQDARVALEPPARRSGERIDDASEVERVGFHARERHAERDFRWTTPSALLRFSLTPGEYEGCIETGGLRADLATAPFVMRFNATHIPAWVDGDAIRFRLPRSGFAAGPEQRLAWACAPVRRPRGGEETRRLGIPVIEIRISHRP